MSKFSTKEFMKYVLSYLDRNDFLHDKPTYILFYLIKETPAHTTSIIIDKNTNIISFPNKSTTIKYNLDNFQRSSCVDPNLFNHANMSFISNLNMLVMSNDASHRLASLYLYVQNGFVFKLKKKNLRYSDSTIDINKLKNYYFSPRDKLIFILINNQVKHQELLDDTFYDLLIDLQYVLLGFQNLLSISEVNKFKTYYKNRNKSPLELAQDRLKLR